MIGISSGEFYTQAGDFYSLWNHATTFRDYLDIDSSYEAQLQKYHMLLRKYQKARELSRSLYYKKLIKLKSYSSTITRKSVKISNDVKSTLSQAVRYSGNINKNYDSRVMEILLSYFSLVKSELLENQVSIEWENKAFQSHKEQALLVQNLKCFAHYVFYETRRKVVLEVLPKDSPQYQQCRQAAKDNVSMITLKAVGYDGINILRVIKLRHDLLTSQLQAQIVACPQVKVKGLFCIVPRNCIYAFLALGIHGQLPHNILTDQNCLSLSELMKSSWFSFPPSESSFTILDKNSVLIEEGKGKRLVEDQVGFAAVRFSKCSTPANLRDLDETELEQGIHIALCRVVLSRVHNVSGAIAASDLEFAKSLGCDGVHSTTLDEFVILDPRNVLPEFIILVQLTKSAAEGVSAHSKEKQKQHSKSYSNTLPVAFRATEGLTHSLAETSRLERSGNGFWVDSVFSILQGNCCNSEIGISPGHSEDSRKSIRTSVELAKTDVETSTTHAKKTAAGVAILDNRRSQKRSLLTAVRVAYDDFSRRNQGALRDTCDSLRLIQL